MKTQSKADVIPAAEVNHKAFYLVTESHIAQVVTNGFRVVFDASGQHAFGEFIHRDDHCGEGIEVEYVETDFNDLSPFNARRMTEEIFQARDAFVHRAVNSHADLITLANAVRAMEKTTEGKGLLDLSTVDLAEVYSLARNALEKCEVR
jgi:hypothetical protein